MTTLSDTRRGGRPLAIAALTVCAIIAVVAAIVEHRARSQHQADTDRLQKRLRAIEQRVDSTCFGVASEFRTVTELVRRGDAGAETIAREMLEHEMLTIRLCTGDWPIASDASLISELEAVTRSLETRTKEKDRESVTPGGTVPP